MPDYLQPLIDNSDPDLSDSERRSLSDLVTEFKDIFLPPDGKLNQTDLAEHYIDTGETKVSKVAKIRKRYNQVPHLTQDTNGKVTNSQKTAQTRAKRSALSQQVTTKHI